MIFYARYIVIIVEAGGITTLENIIAGCWIVDT